MFGDEEGEEEEGEEDEGYIDLDNDDEEDEMGGIRDSDYTDSVNSAWSIYDINFNLLFKIIFQVDINK